MDNLLRLKFGLFMLVCLALLALPKVSNAAWEYTPKVSTYPNGGQSKQQTTKYRGQSGGHLFGTYGVPNPWIGPGFDTLDEYCAGLVGQSTHASTCQWNGAGSYVRDTISNGVGVNGSPLKCRADVHREGWANAQCSGDSAWGPNPAGTYDTTGVETYIVESCPQGYSEQGGQCYPLACPVDAGNPWAEDPADPSQCRRAAECPYPQQPNPSTGVCECGSGTVYRFDEGSSGVGLATPITATWSVTSPVTTQPPSSSCMTYGGNTEGCEIERESCSHNGTSWTCYGRYFSGSSCTAGAGTDSQQTSNKPCPDGQVQGTVNGDTRCVTAGTTESVKAPKTTTETKTNADGSTTTTTTTSQDTVRCEDGKCTTTTSTTTSVVHKDAQGNVTGTETTSGTSSGGGGGNGSGSSFAGSCESGFQCEGDAVQCAIALEQHKRSCEILGDKGSFTRADAEAEFDASRTFDKAQLTQDGGEFGTNIAATGFLGGSCVQDYSFSVMGQTYAIPFASLCPYLDAAGLAFLAVCGILSFRIVSRGVA